MGKYIYNYINDECDWCEQTKNCRGLEDYPGNVVLVICEDCDTKGFVADSGGTTEFDPMNTTTKENTVMTNTAAFTNCIAINKGNHNKCQSPSNKIIVPVMVKAGEAVHEDLYKSGNLVGWFRHELPFCITHGNQLLNGKVVMIQSLKARPEQLTIEVTTTKEEDDMTNLSTMTIEELEELAADLFQEGAEIHQNRSAYETEEEWKELLDMTSADLAEVEEVINSKKETTMDTTKKVLCGHCKGYHSNIGEVRACYRPVHKLPMRENKGVLCGNCRKNGVKDPYHATAAEVKACYQGNS